MTESLRDLKMLNGYMGGRGGHKTTESHSSAATTRNTRHLHRRLTGYYLLTPWCRVLLEKLTGLQLVKKFPVFYGTRRFITALKSVRHLSLSWASPIQSTHPHLPSSRSILILSTHLRLGLPSGLFPSGFPTKTLYAPSPHPYAPHAQPISFSILSPAQYWVRITDHLAPRYAQEVSWFSKCWFSNRSSTWRRRLTMETFNEMGTNQNTVICSWHIKLIYGRNSMRTF